MIVALFLLAVGMIFGEWGIVVVISLAALSLLF